jgi:hypothetical protein
MECFFNLIGGIGGVIAYLAPSLFGIAQLPPVQLLVSVVLMLFGIAFSYFYLTVNRVRAPLAVK